MSKDAAGSKAEIRGWVKVRDWIRELEAAFRLVEVRVGQSIDASYCVWAWRSSLVAFF